MLLIVFIENAFKHSKKSATQQIYIDISLKTWGNSILFSVKNSQSKMNIETGNINKNSGFGLANVAKRLELLYPNDHRLDIQNDDEFYTVMLQVQKK
jgi:LytS/YehU family sensor histidine kinase